MQSVPSGLGEKTHFNNFNTPQQNNKRSISIIIKNIITLTVLSGYRHYTITEKKGIQQYS